MILEHPINRGENRGKPSITFNYITPSLVPRTYTLARCPPTTPLPFIPHQKAQFKTQFPSQQVGAPLQGRAKSQRKKIFDRTYSVKGSFFNPSKLKAERGWPKSSGKSSAKKVRRAIFSKDKKRTPVSSCQQDPRFNATSLQYRTHNSSLAQLKPPSSLTSYIDVDALRRESKQSYFANVSGRQHENPFEMGMLEQSEGQPNASSNVKVDISYDSDANQSVQCSSMPASVTQERFFDRDASHAPKKIEKLSQVNLYSTAINGNFSKAKSTPPSLFEQVRGLVSSQLHESLLPYLLIVMGVFLLLVQVSK